MAANQYEPPKRRWFQFRLRSLLLAVALIAFVLGWLWPQITWIHQRRQARAYVDLSLNGRRNAPLSLRVFGEKGVAQATVWTPENERAEIVEMRRQYVEELFPEAEVISMPIRSY